MLINLRSRIRNIYNSTKRLAVTLSYQPDDAQASADHAHGDHQRHRRLDQRYERRPGTDEQCQKDDRYHQADRRLRHGRGSDDACEGPCCLTCLGMRSTIECLQVGILGSQRFRLHPA